MRVDVSHSQGPCGRRVVITGMGVVAPNGSNLKRFWESISGGKSAAGPLTRFQLGGMPCHLACEIKDFQPEDYIDAKAANRLDLSTQYGIAAAKMAISDGGVDFDEIDPDRTGVVEATSLSNHDAVERARKAYDARGHRAITPSMVVGGYVGSGSAEIATIVGCKGHALTCSSSSASGNDVMGYAKGMIQNEDVDVMLAGGAEAPLRETAFAGFAHSRAMTRWTGPPAEAMKPFDRAGDGFVMGEGAGFVILEEMSHALSRGARIYAELLAHGRSCEAYHAMAPQPDGAGLVRAMEKAFRTAGLPPNSIDYINAHGTANAVNDIAETRAIKTFFGAHARQISVNSTKPVTGHLLAAAGALETVICTLAIQHQVIPPTINLKEPLPECDLDYVSSGARPYPIRAVVNLNSGFGGKTSCMLLARYKP